MSEFVGIDLMETMRERCEDGKRDSSEIQQEIKAEDTKISGIDPCLKSIPENQCSPNTNLHLGEPHPARTTGNHVLDARAKFGELAVRVSDRCLYLPQDERRTSLGEFLHEVAGQAGDGGQLMTHVTCGVLDDFQSHTENAFGYRMTRVDAVLAHEEMSVYRWQLKMMDRMLNRSELALSRVQHVMPEFQWTRYVQEPGYVRSLVMTRLGMDDNMDSDRRKVRGKLRRLKALRSEVDLVECYNQNLDRKEAALIAELAEIERNAVKERRWSVEETNRLTLRLHELRAQSAEQMTEIDKLLMTVRMLIHASESDSAASRLALEGSC